MPSIKYFLNSIEYIIYFWIYNISSSYYHAQLFVINKSIAYDLTIIFVAPF